MKLKRSRFGGKPVGLLCSLMILGFLAVMVGSSRTGGTESETAIVFGSYIGGIDSPILADLLKISESSSTTVLAGIGLFMIGLTIVRMQKSKTTRPASHTLARRALFIERSRSRPPNA